MKLRIRYFASLREAIGCAQEDFDEPVNTVGEVRDVLLARGGAYLCLHRNKAVRTALDQAMVNEDTSVHENSELAFFPPVTGG